MRVDRSELKCYALIYDHNINAIKLSNVLGVNRHYIYDLMKKYNTKDFYCLFVYLLLDKKVFIYD